MPECTRKSAVFTGTTAVRYPAGDKVTPTASNGAAYTPTYGPGAAIVKHAGVKQRRLWRVIYLKPPAVADTVEFTDQAGAALQGAGIYVIGDGVTAPQSIYDFGGLPLDAFGVKLGAATARVLVEWEDVA